MIRIDAIWLAVDPIDLRAGMDSTLGRVVSVFGAAHPHHAYLFLNRRGDRMKVLVCDGFGIWLAARRLYEGRFAQGAIRSNTALSREQFDALVVGLPWRRVGEAGSIAVI